MPRPAGGKCPGGSTGFAPQGNAGASPRIVLPDAMTVEALAALVIDACESEGVEHLQGGDAGEGVGEPLRGAVAGGPPR